MVWIAAVYILLNRRVYECGRLHLLRQCLTFVIRFPRSFRFVVADFLERIYLAAFPLLLAFTVIFPLLIRRPAVPPTDQYTAKGANKTDSQDTMDFLPLMLTSVYCSIGLIWGFLRLGFIYLHEESSYQGQLSELK